MDMCREIDGGVGVLLLFYRIQMKYKLTGRRKFMSIEIEVLRHIPLFKQLGQEDLAQVALMTQERRYERGDLILLEGDLGGALHYVHAGLVKVFKTSPSGKEQV